MFIDFEGIDGSGKTTLSNRVALRLKARGLPVRHARANGVLCSPIAERIRALTRDSHHLSLSETAEFLLYSAREAQTAEEIVRPALARNEWVITDRYVYSALAMAQEGRGLSHPALPEVVEFASGGLLPDLVIFVDVEPAIARARKRCGKFMSHKENDPSRKGQAGAGLPHRVRKGFIALARAEPERWIVFDNTWASLDEAEESLTQLILARADGRSLPAIHAAPPPYRLSAADQLGDEAGLRRSLMRALDAIAHREPPLAAYLMRGLCGQDINERRIRLAHQAPAVVAHSLFGLGDEQAMLMRHALKSIEPRAVALSLTGWWGETELTLRQELAARAPAEVARSLEGIADEPAMRLREKLMPDVPGAVLLGLGGVDCAKAWEMREKLATVASADQLAYSLKGLGSPAAFTMRHRLLASAPLMVVQSLAGVEGEAAHALRVQFLQRAPRAVLETLVGLDDDRSWSLRETASDRMREVVDSVAMLNTERAWKLRERLSSAWPASCIRSLDKTARTERGQQLLWDILRRYPDNLEAVHRAVWVLDPARTMTGAIRDALLQKAV